MAGLLVAFAGLFWLHSVKASAYIASGTSASGGIIVTMLQAGQKLGWDGKLAAVSFLGVLWWIAGVAPVTMLLLQLPGWGWTLWRKKIAFWPVMTLAVFWVAFIVIVGPYSSYWGLMFMPIAYAGTGALIAKLGSEGRRRRRRDRIGYRMKRALITGAAGQDGTYLTELLLSKGYEVWGVIGPEPGEYLAWAAEQGEHLHPCEADLADAESLDRLIAEVVPDEVYNFAGISSVALSWDCPTLVADINATGVARLIEAIRTHAPEARLLPGDLGRDLRQRRGVAPDRIDADPPHHAVRLGEGARALPGRERAPRVGRVRVQRDPLQPRVAPAARVVRDGQDRRDGRAHQAGPCRRAAPGQPRRRARLGVCRRLRRGHVADAASRARPTTTSWRPA